MKNLTWQNPEQLFVAQELINKVKSKCCGIKVKTKLIMALLGKPGLAKYLFGLNRYMWLDSAAHLCFDDYVEVINQLYVKPRLEIEVW